MSYQRKVKYLQEMFDSIGSEEERLRVQNLYQTGHKGSAVVFMLRRVHAKWQEYQGSKSTVKITRNGESRFMTLG